jgi:hypothetical protein
MAVEQMLVEAQVLRVLGHQGAQQGSSQVGASLVHERAHQVVPVLDHGFGDRAAPVLAGRRDIPESDQLLHGFGRRDSVVLP